MHESSTDQRHGDCCLGPGFNASSVINRTESTMATRKKPSRKSPGRRYSKGASKKVAATMRERKRGTLRSGRSGKKVTSQKQAIAIGLSEARRSGAKVPRKGKSSRKAARKGAKRRAAQ
jgi:hypothetical protein